jgi:hypothetical protein
MSDAGNRSAGSLKYFLLLPILLKLSHLRQITVSRNHAQFGNDPVVTVCPKTRQLPVTRGQSPAIQNPRTMTRDP